jgi:site-specific recombinase XerD
MLPAVVRLAPDRAALRPALPVNLPPLQAVRLLDQLRERIRMLHYSLRTEQAYLYWCRAFVRFHGLRHPATMGGPEVETYLTYLASDRGLAPSSHRQALSALLFLYGKVLRQQLPWMQEIDRPVPKRRLPVVLSQDEVVTVLDRMQGVHQLLARLLYGTGLRITEALCLRVKDVDFSQRAIYVRQGKGGKDRVVMLPQVLVQPLREQLGRVRQVWAADGKAGCAGVECLCPGA